MSAQGNIQLHDGVNLKLNYVSTTSLKLDISADPTANWTMFLPPNPPAVSGALVVDPAGAVTYQALTGGGGGTVTSVGLTAPSIFTVSGSPVTTSGSLNLSLTSQPANTMFAAPDGAAGIPAFRLLLPSDIPSLLPSKITGFDTQVRTSRLDQMAVPTAPIAMGGQKLSGVADPTLAQDGATKNYVDSLVTGAILYKGVVDASAASPAAAGVSGAPVNGWQYRVATAGSTAFGFALNVGDFVIYNGTAWDKIDSTDPSITGVTNRTTVTPTGDTAYQLDIASTYVGQASITTVGTIASGTWNGSAIPVANGGTGATTAAAARVNLGVAGVFNGTFTSANLVAGILTVTHNLNNQFPNFRFYDNNNKWFEPDDVTATSATVSTVDLSTFGTIVGTFKYVYTG